MSTKSSFILTITWLLSHHLFAQVETESNSTPNSTGTQILSSQTTITGSIGPFSDASDFWNIVDGASGTLIATWSGPHNVIINAYGTSGRNTLPAGTTLSSGSAFTLSGSSFYSLVVNYPNPASTSYSVVLTGTALTPVITAPTEIDVAVTVLLEGPYNGSTMNTTIASNIPLNQPYDFNSHSGGTAASIPAGAVDWVLVELREAASAATANNASKVGSAAGFLMSDGSIKATNGTSDLTIALSGNTGAAFYIVIYHRNHLPIMSASAISESGGVYTIDFTSNAANTYQNASALSSLSGGKLGMIAGDQNSDGQVNATDLTNWRSQNGGTFSYGSSTADFNLDGQVNAVDRNDFQQPNSGKSSQVPN